jgi:translation initiation factor 4E
MAAAIDANSQVDLTTIPVSPGGANDNDAENNITVFHDKDNFNVIHPLMNTWTLWFTKPPSGKVRTPPREEPSLC